MQRVAEIQQETAASSVAETSGDGFTSVVDISLNNDRVAKDQTNPAFDENINCKEVRIITFLYFLCNC